MATMVEFAVVLVIKQRKGARKRKSTAKTPMKEENVSSESLLFQTLKRLENGMTLMVQDNPTSIIRMIDYIALLTFSITYLSYNCFYFAQLMYSYDM